MIAPKNSPLVPYMRRAIMRFKEKAFYTQLKRDDGLRLKKKPIYANHVLVKVK